MQSRTPKELEARFKQLVRLIEKELETEDQVQARIFPPAFQYARHIIICAGRQAQVGGRSRHALGAGTGVEEAQAGLNCGARWRPWFGVLKTAGL